MIELQIILEKQLAEKLEAIGEKFGISLDMIVVMACQKYVKWVERFGLPRITGVKFNDPDVR